MTDTSTILNVTQSEYEYFQMYSLSVNDSGHHFETRGLRKSMYPLVVSGIQS